MFPKEREEGPFQGVHKERKEDGRDAFPPGMVLGALVKGSVLSFLYGLLLGSVLREVQRRCRSVFYKMSAADFREMLVSGARIRLEYSKYAVKGGSFLENLGEGGVFSRKNGKTDAHTRTSGARFVVS